MNVPRRLAVLFAVMVFAGGLAMPARAATSTIGILVYDGFLTSDVTAPVEVFGAASKKAWFSSYKVVTVSTTKQRVVPSEEGLTILADKTIYDPLSLDVLIVPSAYKMDGVLKNTDVINFIKQQGRSASWMASNCSGARLLSEAGILDGKHRSEEHTSELQSQSNLVCRLLLEKKKTHNTSNATSTPDVLRTVGACDHNAYTS